MDEHPTQTWKPLVLAGHAGLRIRGLGPSVANSAIRWPRVLALADVAGFASGTAKARSEPFTFDDVRGFEYRDPSVLCRRSHVRPAQQSGHRRVLALVGSASLGRRLL